MNINAPRDQHKKGLLLGLLGVLLLSPDTLIIRLVDTDPWTFIAWRGALMAIGMTAILITRFGLQIVDKTLAIGWNGLLIAFNFSFMNVFFQLSVQSTSVANTLVIVATAPLFAALMSVLFLKETVRTRTWIAIIASLLGVAIVFSGRLENADLLGNLFALIVSIGLGLHFVLVRLARPIDMAPAIGIASIFTCLIGLFIAADLYLQPIQFGYLTILGIILLPASFIFLTQAPQFIPAAEVSLILLLETLLGPLWVWLVITEEPPTNTLVGGMVIIAALAIHAILGLKTPNRFTKNIE